MSSAPARDEQRRALLRDLAPLIGVYTLVLPQGRPIPTDGLDLPDIPPHRSLRAGLDWCQTRHQALLDTVRHAFVVGHHDLCWRLAWALTAYLERHAHHDALVATVLLGVEAAAADTGPDAPAAEAWLSMWLGDALWHQRRHEAALDTYRDAHEIADSVGDELSIAYALRGQALAHLDTGRYTTALDRATRALRILQRLGDERGQGLCVLSLADAHHCLGQHHHAVRESRRARHLFRRLDNPWSHALATRTLARATRALGHHDDAARHYTHAADQFRRLSDPAALAETQLERGQFFTARGATEAARIVLTEARTLYTQLDDDRASRAAELLAALPSS